jgi:hypothetical protein
MGCSIHGDKPCICCKCNHARTGRVHVEGCPVPTHAARCNSMAMGQMIGREMGTMLAKRETGR